MKISLSTLLTLPLTFLLVRPAEAQQSQLNDKIDSNIQDWLGTYKHLHENPQLSTQKKETSALVASELKKLGYEVTDHFGQYEIADAQAYGVVAVLKNGNGSPFMCEPIWTLFPSRKTPACLMPAKWRSSAPMAARLASCTLAVTICT
jgi:hippurate hydrolase